MKKLESTKNKKIRKKYQEKGLPYLTIIVLIGLWQLLTWVTHIPSYILPSPWDIGTSLIYSGQVLWEHTLTTMFEATIGFFISIVFALLVAIMMNQWKLLKASLYPILVISQTVPIIALAPLIMIWMGFGSLPKIIVVVVVCFFPISVNVVEGLSTVDRDLINIMKVMGSSKWQIFTKVELPATLPAFFSGLKIAATYSIMGAVIGEWLGAQRGLGIFMTRAMSSFRTPDLFAAIIIVVFLSMFLFSVVELLARKAMPWNR